MTASLGSRRTPLGLVIGAFLCTAWAALTAMVVPLAAAGALPLSVGGAPVPADRWMRVTGPLVVAAGLVMAIFAAGVAARRAWTRPLAPLLGAGIALYGAAGGLFGTVPPVVAGRSAVGGLALTVLSVWYFYFTRGVDLYYRSLRRD